MSEQFIGWQFELTDTFGGEANYCWVRREDMPDLEGKSDRAVVRALKRWAGLNGLRCETSSFGDEFWCRPVGRNAPAVIAFASFRT